MLKTVIGGVIGAAAHGYYNHSKQKSVAEGIGRGSFLGATIGVGVNYNNVNKLYNVISGNESAEPSHEERLRELSEI